MTSVCVGGVLLGEARKKKEKQRKQNSAELISPRDPFSTIRHLFIIADTGQERQQTVNGPGIDGNVL